MPVQDPDKPKGRGPVTVTGYLDRGPLSLRPQRSASCAAYSLAETGSSVVGEASAAAETLSLEVRVSSIG